MSKQDDRQAIREAAELMFHSAGMDGIVELVVQSAKMALQAYQNETIRIIDEQPFYPDTNVGKRQQWVKDEIKRKVLEFIKLEPKEPVQDPKLPS
jgi:hypothetical protein